MATSHDHLFISYANEDGALAEWLTLRLTSLGYKVWCDRVKLLGGESYPRNIDIALKEQTFRMLALLSSHSVAKPNPVKERTLAHAIARERGEFMIPLNVDGLSASQLDWMTSDLTFIPFNNGWGPGLAALLKKLASIGTPRAMTDGRGAVEQWLRSSERVDSMPEKLWTNLLPLRLPDVVNKITLARGSAWPIGTHRYRQSDRLSWSFVEPQGVKFDNVEQIG